MAQWDGDLESTILSADDSLHIRIYNLEKMPKSRRINCMWYKAPLNNIPFDVIVAISNSPTPASIKGAIYVSYATSNGG